MDEDNNKGPTMAWQERRTRALTSTLPTPSLVVASKEKAKQPCRTTMAAVMDAAATGTRARTTVMLSAPYPVNTAAGKAPPALLARVINHTSSCAR